MTLENHALDRLKERILSLRHVKPRDLCWELGNFQTPMLVKNPGETPLRPYLLVCIDTESRAVMGSALLGEVPSPKEHLSLLMTSMETPCVDQSNPVVPHSIRLNHPEALKLLKNELAQLSIKFEFANQLHVVREFAEIAERDFFSRQIGFAGGKN